MLEASLMSWMWGVFFFPVRQKSHFPKNPGIMTPLPTPPLRFWEPKTRTPNTVLTDAQEVRPAQGGEAGKELACAERLPCAEALCQEQASRGPAPHPS